MAARARKLGCGTALGGYPLCRGMASKLTGGSVAKSLVITEKPSVARDITAALGGFQDHDGYWESDDYLVTFAVGHLLELLSPEEIDPE